MVVRRAITGAVVLRANRLTDGVVVWLTADGWSEQVADAQIAADDAARAALETRAAADEERNLVVGAEAAPVAQAETPQVTLIKDVVRAKGPTVRPDLGPQAKKD